MPETDDGVMDYRRMLIIPPPLPPFSDTLPIACAAASRDEGPSCALKSFIAMLDNWGMSLVDSPSLGDILLFAGAVASRDEGRSSTSRRPIAVRDTDDWGVDLVDDPPPDVALPPGGALASPDEGGSGGHIAAAIVAESTNNMGGKDVSVPQAAVSVPQADTKPDAGMRPD